MKKLSYPVIAAVAGVLLASAAPARAGGTSCCDNRVAASPKVQATLDERCNSHCAAPGETAAATTTRQTDFAASPKVQQMRTERAAAAAPEARPTGSDGIAASPRVRAQLNERPQSVEIAPLK